MTGKAWGEKAVKDIQAALKEFGRYQFVDKGPSEVMPMPTLEALTAEESIIALHTVLDAKALKPEIREIFVSAMLVMHQDMPDEWFAAVTADERIGPLF